MIKLSHSKLKEILSYDMNTGEFIWLERPNASFGFNANHAGKNPGNRITIGVEKFSAGKLAVFYVTGRLPKRIQYSDGNHKNIAFSNLIYNRKIDAKPKPPRPIGVIQNPKTGKWQVNLPDGTTMKCTSIYDGAIVWSEHLPATKTRQRTPKKPARKARRI